MAMIGRNAAVAEVGEHELQVPVAFAAWLGVHAALLTTARAKIETFVEWGWDYFGKAHADPVLDRTSQADESIVGCCQRGYFRPRKS
jgi:NADH:ubiquinone reductase (H+-translocating)